MSNVSPISRPVNDGGVTPTTVNGRSAMVSVLPIADVAAAERRLPERVAHHCRFRSASPAVVVGPSSRPRIGGDAEHLEEIAAHPQAAGPARVDAAPDHEPGVAPREHPGERLLVAGDQLPERIGGFRVDAFVAAVGLRTVGTDFREVLSIVNRQEPQPDGVEQLKDGGVRADAERERQDRHGREDRTAAQEPQSIPQVAHRVLGDADPALIAAVVLVQRDAAQGAKGRATRLRGGHAALEVEVDLPIEVVLQFVIELALDRVPLEQRSQAKREHIAPAVETHRAPPEARSSRFPSGSIADVPSVSKRSQFRRRSANEPVDIISAEATLLVVVAAHRDLGEDIFVAQGVAVGIDVEHDAVHLEQA